MANERHHRNTLLPGWSQERLTAASVIIMGMGALGNAAAQSLALAGVGRLILCDMDRIERSNLSRAPLFQESDIGRYKVEAAAEALGRIAPDVRVEVRPDRLEYAVGLAELRDADLTLGCLDSRAVRLELAGRCGLVSAPWIDGATGQWSGEIRPFLVPPDGPCCGCGLTEAARSASDAPQSCNPTINNTPVGAAAPLSTIVGAEMALLAARWIMELPVTRDILVLQGDSGRISPVEQRRDSTCPYHAPLPAARPLPLNHTSTVGELLDLLDADAHPLTWKPFQISAKCRKCDFSEERIGKVETGACPRCGVPIHSRTQLDIRSAPRKTKLQTLGVAPREILVVKTGDRIRYIELANQ